MSGPRGGGGGALRGSAGGWVGNKGVPLRFGGGLGVVWGFICALVSWCVEVFKEKPINGFISLSNGVFSLLSSPPLATRLLAHKIQSPQEWEAIQALTVRAAGAVGFLRLGLGSPKGSFGCLGSCAQGALLRPRGGRRAEGGNAGVEELRTSV